MSSGKGPRDRYYQHRIGAGIRGISFLLTFEEWMRIWLDSGHWDERGCKRGQYVMARYADSGPYSVENVRIIRSEENHCERNLGRKYSAESKKKMSISALGHTRWLGKHHTDATKQKMRQSHLKRLENVIS